MSNRAIVPEDLAHLARNGHAKRPALGRSISRAKAIPAACTARHQRPQSFAEFTWQREQKEQERRSRMIEEFNSDPHAMAAEILRYRRGLAQVADAIDWIHVGEPFVTLGPGPVLNDREIEDDRCS
jgi:hypothetical protein